jgi:hypothetical protein
MMNEQKEKKGLTAKEAFDILGSFYPKQIPGGLIGSYARALLQNLESFSPEILGRGFMVTNRCIAALGIDWPSIPTVQDFFSGIEAILESERAAEARSDFQSIRATELAAYIAAQNAKLPEVRKKFPNAFVSRDGTFKLVVGLKREPTEEEIRQADR